MILHPPAEQHFVLYNVDWDTYVTISDKLGERNIRLNYDGVNLEFMTTSLEHERAKKLLARLLETVTEEMNIDILGGGVDDLSPSGSRAWLRAGRMLLDRE